MGNQPATSGPCQTGGRSADDRRNSQRSPAWVDPDGASLRDVSARNDGGDLREQCQRLATIRAYNAPEKMGVGWLTSQTRSGRPKHSPGTTPLYLYVTWIGRPAGAHGLFLSGPCSFSWPPRPTSPTRGPIS